MTATHIYIDKNGIPCALTIYYPAGHNDSNELARRIEEVKQSAIPIREDDRPPFFQRFIPHFAKNDTFYHVEPYEFEVKPEDPFAAMAPDNVSAFIIRPEVKPTPSKELTDSDLKKMINDAYWMDETWPDNRNFDVKSAMFAARLVRDHFQKGF